MCDARQTPDRGPAEGREPPDDLRLAAHLRTLKRIHPGVAHDLRAPLGTVFLNLELLRRALADDAPPEFAARRSAWLGTIEKELAHLRQALEALLLEFAPGTDVQDRFDLRDLLAHLGRLLAAQARQQRLALAVQVPDEPVTVLADRDAVRQACLHLVVDALERAGAGGRVQLTLDRDGDSARLRIVGDGSGPARLDAVARAIVEQQGGHVGADDAAGSAGPLAGGTERGGIVVALPLARAAGAGAAGR